MKNPLYDLALDGIMPLLTSATEKLTKNELDALRLVFQERTVFVPGVYAMQESAEADKASG